MTPQQLMEWESWYMIEMPRREDFYMQQLLAMTYNAHFKGPQKRGSDFAPDLRTPAQKMAAQRVRVETAAEDERLTKWGVEVLKEQRRKGQAG